MNMQLIKEKGNMVKECYGEGGISGLAAAIKLDAIKPFFDAQIICNRKKSLKFYKQYIETAKEVFAKHETCFELTQFQINGFPKWMRAANPILIEKAEKFRKEHDSLVKENTRLIEPYIRLRAFVIEAQEIVWC